MCIQVRINIQIIKHVDTCTIVLKDIYILFKRKFEMHTGHVDYWRSGADRLQVISKLRNKT